MSSYLIDTNAAIALINRDEDARRLAAQAEWITTSVTVIGELFFGAENSSRRTENIAAIETFMETLVVFACDEATARIYGSIKHQLRSKGRPIPENDIWIAAVALQHDLTLITRDKHFAEVDGLTTESW